MLSQNVAKAAVPSNYMMRTNLPHRKPQHQWEGVLYYSGITRLQQRRLLLQRKRERMACLQTFHATRAQLLQRYDALVHNGDDGGNKGNSNGNAMMTSADGQAAAASRVALACALAQCGLHTHASQLVDELHTAQALSMAQYVALLDALAAEQLRVRVLHADAAGDPTLTYKLMADDDGDARAATAYRWYDMAMAQLARRGLLLQHHHHHTTRVDTTRPSLRPPTDNHTTAYTASSAATQLTNALMHALLRCGYAHVQAVAGAVYDRMGVAGIAPTARTYDCVALSLCLQGNVDEAEHIARYCKHRHGDHVGIGMYNALLLGHREARAYDKCDALWGELVDARWPRANALTAELYLRSIMDHSYTPTSAPLRHFGELHVVEKKKVPVVLTQLDGLGIARADLSRPLRDECEDALRKYGIYKSRFYDWGRAVHQFNFIEFRRRHGWLYGINLMHTPTTALPPARDATTPPDGNVAPAATVESPSFMCAPQPWECDALSEELAVTTTSERNEDVRAGDIYDTTTRAIHARSATWMNDVPQTRYDKLYGVNNPDIAQIGIRRHLDVEYVNRSEVVKRDAAIMRRTLTSGRRLRQRVEAARTHRNEGTLTKTTSTKALP